MKTITIVRWLLAFRNYREYSLKEAVDYELKRNSLDIVSCEPIWNGKSRLTSKKTRIGLMVDMELSEFVKGYAFDAYTLKNKYGFVYATRHKGKNLTCSTYEELYSLGRNREEKIPYEYGSYYNANECHGEVLIRNVHYKAVVLRKGTKGNSTRRKARELAREFGLPLVTEDGHIIME